MEIGYDKLAIDEKHLANRRKIYEIVKENELKKKEKGQLKDFNFMAANLRRFLPELPSSKYWQTYLQIITTMRLREYDISELYTLSDQIMDQFQVKSLQNSSPKLYVTCHLGFCKASMGFLILNGVSKIALIVDKHTFEKQSERIMD